MSGLVSLKFTPRSVIVDVRRIVSPLRIDHLAASHRRQLHRLNRVVMVLGGDSFWPISGPAASSTYPLMTPIYHPTRTVAFLARLVRDKRLACWVSERVSGFPYDYKTLGMFCTSCRWFFLPPWIRCSWYRFTLKSSRFITTFSLTHHLHRLPHKAP